VLLPFFKIFRSSRPLSVLSPSLIPTLMCKSVCCHVDDTLLPTSCFSSFFCLSPFLMFLTNAIRTTTTTMINNEDEGGREGGGEHTRREST
jgi:hypothetical protein